MSGTLVNKNWRNIMGMKNIQKACQSLEEHCENCRKSPMFYESTCEYCIFTVLRKVLERELKSCRSLIYGIDFDGTIVEEKFPVVGKPKMEVIDFIRRLKRAGHRWILITMREEKYLDDALSFLAMYDILPDGVNDNLPDRVEMWGNNPRKVYADIYIDDHNAGGIMLPEIPERSL